MYFSRTILFAIVCLVLFSCKKEEACLVKVDNAMEMRPVYEQRHRARIDSLESRILSCGSDSARFAIFYDIYGPMKEWIAWSLT